MQRTATLATPPAVAPTAFSLRPVAWLRRAWSALMMDADERFLRGARDLADLEWRLKRLERGRAERFGPFHPDA